MNKDQRRLEIYKYVTKHGRVWAQDVVTHIGRLSGDESDNKMRQAVYRDLRVLQESNQIGSRLYTPAGDPIEVEEEAEHANKRVEYYSLAQEYSIRGQNLVEAFESQIYATTLVQESVAVAESYGVIPGGSFILSIELGSGIYRHLWFKQDERPLTFCFGRLGDDASGFNKIFKEKAKGRTVFFSLSNRTVSRFTDNLDCHCAIEYRAEDDLVRVVDFGSTQGTRCYDFGREYLSEASFNAGETAGAVLQSDKFKKIESQQDLSANSMLLIGTVEVQLSYKK